MPSRLWRLFLLGTALLIFMSGFGPALRPAAAAPLAGPVAATATPPAAPKVGAAPATSATFANPGGITINDILAPTIATPYPSGIAVSGLTGVVFKLTVQLTGFAHTYPQDVDILLVSPSGANAIIMSDLGGTTPVSGVNLTLDDAAATPLPSSSLTSGTYQPFNRGSGDI